MEVIDKKSRILKKQAVPKKRTSKSSSTLRCSKNEENSKKISVKKSTTNSLKTIKKSKASRAKKINSTKNKKALKLQSSALRSNIGRRKRASVSSEKNSIFSKIKPKFVVLGGVVLLLVLAFVFWGNNILATGQEITGKLVKLVEKDEVKTYEVTPINYHSFYDVNEAEAEYATIDLDAKLAEAEIQENIAKENVRQPSYKTKKQAVFDWLFSFGNSVGDAVGDIGSVIAKGFEGSKKGLGLVGEKVVAGAKVFGGFVKEVPGDIGKNTGNGILALGDTITKKAKKAEFAVGGLVLETGWKMEKSKRAIGQGVKRVVKSPAVAVKHVGNSVLALGDTITKKAKKAEFAVGGLVLETGWKMEQVKAKIVPGLSAQKIASDNLIEKNNIPVAPVSNLSTGDLVRVEDGVETEAQVNNFEELENVEEVEVVKVAEDKDIKTIAIEEPEVEVAEAIVVDEKKQKLSFSNSINFVLEIGDSIGKTVLNIEYLIGDFLYKTGGVFEGIENATKLALARDINFVKKGVSSVVKSPKEVANISLDLAKDLGTALIEAGLAIEDGKRAIGRGIAGVVKSPVASVKHVGNSILGLGDAITKNAKKVEFALGDWVLETGWEMEQGKRAIGQGIVGVVKSPSSIVKYAKNLARNAGFAIKGNTGGTVHATKETVLIAQNNSTATVETDSQNEESSVVSNVTGWFSGVGDTLKGYYDTAKDTVLSWFEKEGDVEIEIVEEITEVEVIVEGGDTQEIIIEEVVEAEPATTAPTTTTIVRETRPITASEMESTIEKAALTLSEPLTLEKGAVVGGDVEISGDLTVSGNLKGEETLIVSGPVSIEEGDLMVSDIIIRKTGDIVLPGMLEAVNARFTGVVDFSQATVVGLPATGGSTITYTIGGQSTQATNISGSFGGVTYDFSAGRDLDVGEDARVNGTFYVQGTTDLGSVTFRGDGTINGNLTANGNIDLGNALTDTVSIIGTLDSALWASSTLQTSGASTFYATTTLYGTGADLVVQGTGTSTFTGNIEASYLNITGTSGTSTFANGIQLVSGCILLPDGTCAGAGGANTSLSNLSSVAINTSLISDTNNTDDLGSYGNAWKDIYSSGTYFGGAVSSTIIEAIDGGSYSTLTQNFLRHNANTTNASGTLYIDSTGNLYSSGTLYASAIENGSSLSLTSTTSTLTNSLYLGSDTPSRTLTQDGSLFISGSVEVDGLAQFDGNSTFRALTTHPDNIQASFGASSDARLEYDITQTPDSMLFGLGADTNAILFLQTADMTTDFAHPLQTDPTIFLHSSSTGAVREYAQLNYNSLVLQGYNDSSTSTYASDYIRLNSSNTNTSGTFFVDNAGNIYTSGTISNGSSLTLTSTTSTLTNSLYLGSGTPTQALPQDGSLYVAGRSEFIGVSRFFNTAQYNAEAQYAANARVVNNVTMFFGDSYDSGFEYDSEQTPDALFLGVGADSNGFIIGEMADLDTDFTHTLQTDPTIFLHSSSTGAIREYAQLNYNSLVLQGYNDSSTSTYASDYIRLNSSNTNTSGTFFVDNAGNIYTSGTTYANTLSVDGGGLSTSTFSGMGIAGNGATPDSSLALVTIKPTAVNDGIVITETDSDNFAVRLFSATTDGNMILYAGGIPQHNIRGLGEVAFFDYTGNAYDFRIESDNDQELFFTEDATDRIGISTRFPSELLTVYGGNLAIGDGSVTTTIMMGTDDGTNSTSTIAGSLYIGSGTPSRTNQQDGSLYVTGNLEVDGSTRFDTNVTVNSGILFLSDNVELQMGSGLDTSFGYQTGQTPDSLVMGLSTESNGLIIVEHDDIGTNFAHILQTDPTIFLHSSSTGAVREYAGLTYRSLVLQGYNGSGTSTLEIMDSSGGAISSTGTLLSSSVTTTFYAESTADDAGAYGFVFDTAINGAGYLMDWKALDSSKMTLSASGTLKLYNQENIGASSTQFIVQGGGGQSTDNLLDIQNNSGSSLFAINETIATFSQPLEVDIAGDVGFAYDLEFTNSEAAYIRSQSPLYIEAGDINQSSDLVLRAHNYGEVVVSDAAMRIVRATSTIAETFRGLTIDLDDIGTNNGTVIGLDVDISGVASGTTYAGIFQGGYVGIGTTGPSDWLTVASGSIVLGDGAASTTIVAGTAAFGGSYGTSTFESNVYVAGELQVVGDCTEGDGACADLAELYNSIDEVEPGDVVVVAPYNMEDGATVKKSTGAYAGQVAGVVSTDPAITLGLSGGVSIASGRSGNSYKPAVALSGRIPVKISLENGPIEAGDLLVTATKPGYAMKFDPEAEIESTSVAIIGVALESYTIDNLENEDDDGQILTMLRSGFVSASSGSSMSSLTIATDNEGNIIQPTDSYFADIVVESIIALTGDWSITAEGEFLAKEVQTEKVQAEEYSVKITEEKKSVGTSTVLAGEDSLVVNNNIVNEASQIFITFRGNPGGAWWISDQDEGWFEVTLSNEATENVDFDYWVISVVRPSNTPNNTPNDIEEPVVDIEPVLEPAEEELPQEVLDDEGCTDPEALNFDINAYVDDGTCYYDASDAPMVLPILGCTDPEALNFVADATVDDGLCEYDYVPEEPVEEEPPVEEPVEESEPAEEEPVEEEPAEEEPEPEPAEEPTPEEEPESEPAEEEVVE